MSKEFREVYTNREIDPRLICRAINFYIKSFDYHIRNVQHLSQENIKRYCDSVLELMLTLENYSNKIYEDLDEDEKTFLEGEEEIRNDNLYRSDNKIDPKTLTYIHNLIVANNERYEKIRKEAASRIKDK